MGLLDAVLGCPGGPGQGGGGGQAELLRVIVSMLAGAQGGGTGGGGAAGGGLGGMLGAALGGGGAAAGGAPALGGGIDELLGRFRQAGLGDVAQSWVGTGPNSPLAPDELGRALGSDMLERIAGQLRTSPQEAAGQLSQLLPEVVDRLTPEGRVPEGGLGGVDELLARLLRG